MAKEPQAILLRWKDLERNRVRVPVEVWQEFDRNCLLRMDEIYALVTKAEGGDLAVEDAKSIGIVVMQVQKFIAGIGASADGNGFIEEGRVFMDRVALDLVHHYVGNDLFKIVLIADVYEKDPQPIPSGDVGRIVDCLKTVVEFVEQLKSKTCRS